MEYAIFSARDGGVFTEPECLNDMYLMAPKHWWATYGSQVPMLQALAFKLLGQPSSSSCCERNWSTYKFIHSCTRNKLAPKRAQDLVYIHNNLRFLSRRGEAYNKEEQGCGMLEEMTLEIWKILFVLAWRIFLLMSPSWKLLL